jgi:hypothetical protein
MHHSIVQKNILQKKIPDGSNSSIHHDNPAAAALIFVSNSS